MKILALAMVLASTSAAAAPPTRLAPALAGLDFLVGDWSSGRGAVSDTGGTSTGSSRFEIAANGAVLLRRDHTELFDAKGEPTGGFDQIMMIYPEDGALHADYSDGTHVIHYVSAVVDAGKAVSFSSAARPGAPTFKLAYSLSAPKTLAVSFGMTPPGGADFHPIATGTLTHTP